jgi:hypothetical protein
MAKNRMPTGIRFHKSAVWVEEPFYMPGKGNGHFYNQLTFNNLTIHYSVLY